MVAHFTARTAICLALLLVVAPFSQAADQKLGFVTQLEAEGFFLNPIVRKITVTEVTKGSLAEAAGVRAGDQIIQIEKQNVAGRRAMELVPFMKLKPGETRTLRLRHSNGTEDDAKITKPKN